jgi:hypothetical protein
MIAPTSATDATPATIQAVVSDFRGTDPATASPHLWQKRALGDSGVEQFRQVRGPSGFPQELQKFPLALTAPQAGQVWVVMRTK